MTYVPDEQKLVGHADREKCTERLAQAVATGHLTQDVFEQRRDRALVAVKRADLDKLTADLPPEPRPPAKRYRTQLMGDAYPFSPWRWIGSLVAAAALITLPGPVMSAEMGGFHNTPLHGTVAVLLIFAGVLTLFIGGAGFSPVGYDKPDREY